MTDHKSVSRGTRLLKMHFVEVRFAGTASAMEKPRTIASGHNDAGKLSVITHPPTIQRMRQRALISIEASAIRIVLVWLHIAHLLLFLKFRLTSKRQVSLRLYHATTPDRLKKLFSRTNSNPLQVVHCLLINNTFESP